MKKIGFIIVLIIILSLLSCNKKQLNSLYEENESGKENNNTCISNSNTLTDNIEEKIELSTEITLEYVLPVVQTRDSVISYEEYFSIERKFENNYYRYEGGHYLSNLPYKGLYFENEKGKQFLINPDIGIVTTVLLTEYYLLIVEKTETYRLIELNFDGSISKLLFESVNELDCISYDTDLVFFRNEDCIYRTYVSTGNIDILLQKPYILRTYCMELNNWEFSFNIVSTTDMLFINVEKGGNYFYSYLTKKEYKPHEIYYDQDDPSKSYVVGFPDIPIEIVKYDYNQYLYERGQDLLKMGIDPYTISYRTPDDDIYH